MSGDCWPPQCVYCQIEDETEETKREIAAQEAEEQGP